MVGSYFYISEICLEVLRDVFGAINVSLFFYLETNIGSIDYNGAQYYSNIEFVGTTFVGKMKGTTIKGYFMLIRSSGS